VFKVLKFAARAAIWRSTAVAPSVGLEVLLGWIAILGAVRATLEFISTGPAAHFNPYGLNAIIAWLAIELAVAALFVPAAARTTALSAMLALSIVADCTAETLAIIAVHYPPESFIAEAWVAAATPHAIYAAVTLWWIGAMIAVLRSVEAQPRLKSIGKAGALWAALLVANMLMPHAPVAVPSQFDVRNANWWEFLYARWIENGALAKPARGAAAQIMRRQPALLKAEFDRLAPRPADTATVYAIGVAGWDAHVFANELDGALISVGNVLPIKDRVVHLVNYQAASANYPLATAANFSAAVHTVAGAMDKDEDVLVLLMTSHGDKSGIGLQLPGRVINELTPRQVASTLDKEGIKNRVVIVSACFGGIFVKPLANANSIIITAADDKSTSFGCAPGSDWTYFGDAFFRQSLQPGADFQHALDHARLLIEGWELMDNAAPSNPQGYFGAALVEKLRPLISSPPGAAQ